MGEKVDVVMAHDLFIQVESADLGSILIPSRTDPKKYTSGTYSYSETIPNGIKDMIDRIIAAVGKDKKISILRIWSHGITEWILPDAGHEPNNDGIAVLGVNRLGNNTVGSFKADLARLTPFFDKPATVEMRGCGMANGTGKDLMQELARTWGGVSVIASSLNEINVMWKDPTNSVFITNGGAVDKARNVLNVYGQPQ